MLKRRRVIIKTIKPREKIPKDQKWFWTKEWQKKEREADEALKRREHKEFENVKDLLRDLHS